MTATHCYSSGDHSGRSWPASNASTASLTITVHARRPCFIAKDTDSHFRFQRRRPQSRGRPKKYGVVLDDPQRGFQLASPEFRTKQPKQVNEYLRAKVWSLPCILENHGKYFVRWTAFAVIDQEIREAIICVRFRQFFTVGIKIAIFGRVSQFWDTTCHFQD